jgi:hypothetical protein
MRLTDIQEDVLYFNRTDMFAILDMQRKESDKAINSIDPDTLLNTPTDDVVEDNRTCCRPAKINANDPNRTWACPVSEADRQRSARPVLGSHPSTNCVGTCSDHFPWNAGVRPSCPVRLASRMSSPREF